MMGTGSVILSGEHISKRFGGVVALNDVSIAIYAGEIVGLIGPNGSGKSTLINCLTGSIPMTEGRISLLGDDVTGAAPHVLAGMGLTRTFQNLRIFPELTVWQNAIVSQNWREAPWYSMFVPASSAVTDRAHYLLQLMKLDGLVSNLAGNLSGGQRRLLELAMALMPSPKVVMLDEATSGINPSLINSLAHYLEAIRKAENVAFLIVEHNVRFVFSMCDRIVVLHQGERLAEGDASTIQDNAEVRSVYLGA